MRRIFNAHSLFLVLALSTLIFLQLGTFANDPGVGWHLLNGELIAQTSALSGTDPFLYSSTPRPWISDQWLSDLVLHLIYKQGSWPLLYACSIVLYIGIFFVVGRSFYLKLGVSSIGAAIAMFIAFKLGLIHFILRPVLISFALFSIVFFKSIALYEIIIREQNFPKAKLEIGKLLIICPILFALWANLHPAFVLGLVVICTLLAALSVDKLLFKISFPSSLTSSVLLLLAFSTLATLFNPYFLELHKSILTLGSSEYFMALNSEWRSLNFRSAHGRLLELTLVGLALTPFIAPQIIKRWRAFEVLIILSFLHFALRSERMLPYFAIIIAPFLAELISSLLNLRFKNLSKFKASALPFLVVAAALIVFGVRGEIPGFQGEYGPSRGSYPYKAIEFLTQQPGDKKVVYATPNWGGFIAWSSSLRVKPVLDDRNTLIGEDAYRNYFKVINLEPEWKSIVKESGAKFLLLERGKPLANHLLVVSQPIYEDKLSLLFDLSTPSFL